MPEAVKVPLLAKVVPLVLLLMVSVLAVAVSVPEALIMMEDNVASWFCVTLCAMVTLLPDVGTTLPNQVTFALQLPKLLEIKPTLVILPTLVTGPPFEFVIEIVPAYADGSVNVINELFVNEYELMVPPVDIVIVIPLLSKLLPLTVIVLPLYALVEVPLLGKADMELITGIAIGTNSPVANNCAPAVYPPPLKVIFAN